MPDSELTGEPALWAGLVSGIIGIIAAFLLPLTDEHVAALNAVVVAVAGVYVAFVTRSPDNGGSIKAAILGLGQAVLTLALTFGWKVEPEQTAPIMLVLGLAVSLWLRQTSVPKAAVTRA
uniref:hypothetical protein n=1 Tax=Herbidospora sakaeratensis TaxID=564415 RepID=UPI000785B24F|nr:hypothetical protein [Herbidospora sakaeratensis]